MNGDCSANPRPLPEIAMSLKTKEDQNGLQQRLCLHSCNSVQLCISHVRGGKNYLLCFRLPG